MKHALKWESLRPAPFSVAGLYKSMSQSMVHVWEDFCWFCFKPNIEWWFVLFFSCCARPTLRLHNANLLFHSTLILWHCFLSVQRGIHSLRIWCKCLKSINLVSCAADTLWPVLSERCCIANVVTVCFQVSALFSKLWRAMSRMIGFFCKFQIELRYSNSGTSSWHF